MTVMISRFHGFLQQSSKAVRMRLSEGQLATSGGPLGGDGDRSGHDAMRYHRFISPRLGQHLRSHGAASYCTQGQKTSINRDRAFAHARRPCQVRPRVHELYESNLINLVGVRCHRRCAAFLKSARDLTHPSLQRAFLPFLTDDVRTSTEALQVFSRHENQPSNLLCPAHTAQNDTSKHSSQDAV